MITFYLGTHHPNWLRTSDVPLFVSHRRLKTWKKPPIAQVPWALDSGGFSELSLFGSWQTSASEYVDAVRRYARDVGNMDWAAPQDWMCEPIMLKKTGLSIYEHQRRSVQSLLQLRRMAPEICWAPVLQGWLPGDYLVCAAMFEAEGIHLDREKVVGVGSVCRRQGTEVSDIIFQVLHDKGMWLHGFGLKVNGLERSAKYLKSADSMAWSFHGRRRPPMPGHTHKNCANCYPYAKAWRDDLASRVPLVQDGDLRREVFSV